MSILKAVGATIVGLLMITSAQAETRVTYKSAKTTSSYYQMAVQIAEALVLPWRQELVFI